MKILFITQFFYPDIQATSQIFTDLCEDLAKKHKVEVVCGSSVFTAEGKNCERIGRQKYKDIEIPLLSELTFLRNDRVAGAKYAESFPHPLDCDNSDDPPLPLPKCWYR